ncbi:hypothetical protein RHGRI_024366 [Rhododendron griersonianum]|uniref:Uncharacterized protein n=1 Tax=Rhododendron griersonianum TaxID=479676 RepID=A0AAV6JAG3_9ERIC|nr:hypothetical protein RHGRI_024366 [Rhododendron griersonianum]
MMTAVAATARRSRRPSQNQPPTDKGLDVAVPDGSDSLMKRKRSAQNNGNGKQKRARPALLDRIMTRSALQKQQLEKEEKRRIQESRGFDFGAVPPMMGIIDGLDGSDEPCWAESSLYPAPKVYEDLAKIGLKSYNCQLDTSYQFTKIVRVYFREHAVDLTLYNIFFQAEDKSAVASPGDFIIVVGSGTNITVVSSCRKEKDRFGSLACCLLSEYYIGRDRNLR